MTKMRRIFAGAEDNHGQVALPSTMKPKSPWKLSCYTGENDQEGTNPPLCQKFFAGWGQKGGGRCTAQIPHNHLHWEIAARPGRIFAFMSVRTEIRYILKYMCNLISASDTDIEIKRLSIKLKKLRTREYKVNAHLQPADGWDCEIQPQYFNYHYPRTTSVDLAVKESKNKRDPRKWMRFPEAKISNGFSISREFIPQVQIAKDDSFVYQRYRCNLISLAPGIDSYTSTIRFVMTFAEMSTISQMHLLCLAAKPVFLQGILGHIFVPLLQQHHEDQPCFMSTQRNALTGYLSPQREEKDCAHVQHFGKKATIDDKRSVSFLPTAGKQQIQKLLQNAKLANSGATGLTLRAQIQASKTFSPNSDSELALAPEVCLEVLSGPSEVARSQGQPEPPPHLHHPPPPCFPRSQTRLVLGREQYLNKNRGPFTEESSRNADYSKCLMYTTSHFH
ncbi:hypothetical protein MG293_007595 [Ovis ammon polii]|uniref:Uncharacterized protein n=1 Tax=Ovis ammon polii TaxID=230172 RepID=A0AAD4YDA8_OVIAM|nr:hypothetical protein MG293_007595 [Ovis ammon polii]